MESKNCDYLSDMLKDSLFEYLKCISENIIKEITDISQNTALNIIKQELLDTVKNEISDDLRKEIHSLIEEKLLLSNKQEDQINSISDKKTVFYFGAPEKDFTFPLIRKTEQIDSKSVYQFKQVSDNEAEVTIIDDEITYKKMINAFDTYLKGIVKPLNTFTNDFTHITVNKPGKAKLKGNERVIEEKIEVTFK